ncbi:MAG TPA: YbjN domain-containing protein [Solirubrobacteraceae bacterium]|nr:YbjN domain-containing protein [Solirubrobacteraceae bacterium]
MRAGDDSRASDGDVTLATPGGGSVTVDLQRVDAGDGAVVIELLADELAWARIDAGALMHLDPGARGPALGGGFDGPVRIEAVLDTIVMRDLGEPDAGAIAAALREGAPGDRLRDERSWWALQATREVEPPPGVGGELRTGLRTIWRADPPPAGMATVIAAALEAEGIQARLEETGDGEWIVNFRSDDLLGLAVAREATGQAIVYLILPRFCPPERRDELARLVALANFDLPIGCLEASLELGQVRVRTSADVSGDRLSLAEARNLVGAGRHVAAAWLPAVGRVIDGATAEAAAADGG